VSSVCEGEECFGVARGQSAVGEAAGAAAVIAFRIREGELVQRRVMK